MNGSAVVCQTLQSAALANDLPRGFFARLIWQESRFDAQAVSPAGAQGVAQFMPGTAAWVKLANPFDATEAINKSAEFLRNLRTQFGNWGLAAAAYNAGPKRVQDWLTGRRSLPEETQAYVRIVTGHAAIEWSAARSTEFDLALPMDLPCPEIAKLYTNRQGKLPTTENGHDITQEPSVSVPPKPAWGVQLLGNNSQFAALASYFQLQKTYNGVLGSLQPLVIRTLVGRNSYWYRVRIGANSRNDAEKLCSSLRAVGGSCLVQPN